MWRYFISHILLLFVISDLNGQEVKNSYQLGLDLTKTPFNNVFSKGSGYIIEPVLLFFPSKMKQSIKTVIGFAHVERDRVMVNSNFEIDGFYVKAGLGKPIIANTTFYYGITSAVYNMVNNFILQGHNYGDYIADFQQKNIYHLGLELSLDNQLDLGKRTAFLFSVRANLLALKSPIKNNYPEYYVPGVGIVNNRRYTVGINISLLFGGNS